MDLIDRQAAIDAVMDEFKRIPTNAEIRAKARLEELPTLQPERAILLSWIEEHIEWLKSLNNEFANLVVGYISVMLKKWRDEQDEDN